ncbi:MAG: methylated-DNA--[protein]-cysteine S-methyltransferase [Pseudomonadota bacterium]
MTTFFHDRLSSPIGEILIVSDGARLRALDFDEYEERMWMLLRRQYGEVTLEPRANPGGATDAMKQYFAGELNAIDSLATSSCGSAFQERVWKKLREIPTGSVWSYGELAKALGNANASRAVGMANGKNPIAIVVPCHRVIGADGSLTGYGGGMARKRWLLAHEGYSVDEGVQAALNF